MDTMMWTLARVSLRQSVDLAVVDRAGLAAVAPATVSWFRGAVNSLDRYLGCDPDVDRVSPQDVARWLDYEVGRGVSSVSANSNLRALKTLYSRLQRNGVVSSNAAAPVRFLPEPPPRPRAIAEGDYLAMRAATSCSRDRAVLDVLWASGCRRGGLLSMRVDRMEHWRDDGRDRFALLVSEKGRRNRWVYVGRDPLQAAGLVEWLDDRPAGAGPWLWLTFTAPYEGLSSAALSAMLRRCRIGAGIPSDRPCSPHAFRHAFAIRMLDEGMDIAAVSDWLGHHSPEFTASVYVRRSERQLREKYFA